MKLILILLCFLGFEATAQKTNPVNPKNVPAKDTIIYLTPEGSINDTLPVYAFIADLKQPLLLQEYELITKSWIYKGNKKQIAEQWLEKVVDGNATKITNWKKRTVWMVQKSEF